MRCDVNVGRKDDRVGEVGYNNDGEEMRIIRYGNYDDIDIQFVKDGTVIEHRTYNNFLKGSIRNPMTPSVFGIGFIGIGKFKSRDENGKLTKCYETWIGMLRRCYDPKHQEKYPTYKGCKVCKEWWNFQGLFNGYREQAGRG